MSDLSQGEPLCAVYSERLTNSVPGGRFGSLFLSRGMALVGRDRGLLDGGRPAPRPSAGSLRVSLTYAPKAMRLTTP